MLTRSSFKRATYQRQPPSPLRPIRSGVVFVLPARTMPAAREVRTVPKHRYVRSTTLMAAYRLIPCMHCGRDDGTVCGAHANWSIFGKGGHIKADDNRAASLCAACHVPVLDQGSRLSRAERKAMWWAAHVKTVAELLRRRLWPSKIPVPDTTTNPFDQVETD